jgi:hypothetical protein
MGFTISLGSPLKTDPLAEPSQSLPEHATMLSLCAQPVTRQTAKLDP